MTLRARKSHVKRVYRVNPDTGELDKTVWVDVLRFDKFSIEGRGFASGIRGILDKYVLKWLDRPDSGKGDQQQENANPTRKTKKLKLENPENADLFLDLWIVTGQRIKFPNKHWEDTKGWSSAIFQFVYDDVPADGSDPGTPPHRPADRDVRKVRVVNNDLAGLDMSSGPVDWDDVYEPALKKGIKDESQYLDEEVIKKFGLRLGQHSDARDDYSVARYTLKNKKIADLIDVGGAGKNREGEPTKIKRLDPFQIIVNVSWGTGPVIVSVPLRWYWTWVPTQRCGGSGPVIEPNATTYFTSLTLDLAGPIVVPDGFEFSSGASLPNTSFFSSWQYAYGPPADELSPIYRPNWTTTAPFAARIGMSSHAFNADPTCMGDPGGAVLAATYDPAIFFIEKSVDFSAATLTDAAGRSYTLSGAMGIVPASTQPDGAVTVDDPDDPLAPRPYNAVAWLSGASLSSMFLTFLPP